MEIQGSMVPGLIRLMIAHDTTRCSSVCLTELKSMITADALAEEDAMSPDLRRGTFSEQQTEDGRYQATLEDSVPVI